MHRNYSITLSARQNRQGRERPPSVAGYLRSLGISLVIAAAIALRLGAALAEDAPSVTIDNFTFTPPEMTVKVGTTVTWTNHDDIPRDIVDATGAA
jgi:plastocyanin